MRAAIASMAHEHLYIASRSLACGCSRIHCITNSTRAFVGTSLAHAEAQPRPAINARKAARIGSFPLRSALHGVDPHELRELARLALPERPGIGQRRDAGPLLLPRDALAHPLD